MPRSLHPAYVSGNQMRPTLSKLGLIARATTLWHTVRPNYRLPKRSEAGKGGQSQLTNSEFALSALQVEQLIKGATNARDRALIRLMAETGVRRSEVAALTWQDIDVKSRLIVIRNGKGGKLRVVPITATLASAIHALGQARGESNVYLSRQSRSLSMRQINRIVAGAGRRAGIRHPNPKRWQITCHLLRHTFARLWKAEGGSIESLSKILGHTSVKTTWDIYGTESLADIQANYDKTMGQMAKTKTAEKRRSSDE